MRHRLITFAIFGAILVGIGEWDLRNRKLDPLRKLNDSWLEFCAGNSGGKIKDPAVTLVRINDDYEPLTLDGKPLAPTADGAPQKLTRLDFATILGFVGKLGPHAVSFLPTPTFDESNTLNKTDIVPLKDAALQLPRMTLGTVASADKAAENGVQGFAYPTLSVVGDHKDVISFTRTVQSPDPQLLSNGDPAFATIDSARNLSEDGAIRVPLVAKQGDKLVPSFVLQSVAKHAGVTLESISVNLEGDKPFIQIGELYTVPIATDGTMEVPAFAGLKHSMHREKKNEEGEKVEVYQFATLTADELAYTGQADDDIAKRILSEFQGKFDSVSKNLVVIGFDRKSDRRFTTAKGETLSQASLLSRAIATIQSGRYINLWPTWGRWFAVLAIVGIALVVFRFQRGKLILWGSLAALLFFAICVIVFRSSLTWTPPFVMFTLFGLILAIGIILPNKNTVDASATDGADSVEDAEANAEKA